MMRIISGRFKGRYIKTKKGLRPTETKLRKALFDILKDKISGSFFLELFCGTGSIGIEAISRNAKEVVFVDKDSDCIKILKDNLSFITPNTYSIFKSDVFEAINNFSKNKKKFDIIFLDPPYYKGLAKKSLNKLAKYDILSPNGIIVVQHYKKDSIPEKINKLAIFRQEKYSDTLLSFYKMLP
jgi:16S rRNA (guanine(966)-N(2))-methyltransferase RsmD